MGVAPEEDDGVDFAQRMGEIRAELAARQKELAALMKSIDGNLGSVLQASLREAEGGA